MIALYTPPAIHLGVDSLGSLNAQVQRLEAHRVFLITSASTPSRPIFAAVQTNLKAVAKVAVWSEVPAEPGTADLQRALAAAVEANPDVIIGCGGGSVMDIAKLVAILLTNPGSIDQYLGIGRVHKPGRPTIMIPTTAGSGSEVSQDAVLTDRSAGTKYAVKDPHVVPTCAIVDPQATITCPPLLTAFSGLDAFTHAIEAFTARRANPITDMYARQALTLIWNYLPRAVSAGEDLDARLNMAQGSLLAGLAFTNTGTAAIHACGYPLSGLYNIPHGTANALMLPHVVAFNQETCSKYQQLEALLGTSDLPGQLRHFVATVGLPTRLRDAGVEHSIIPQMAAIAAKDERHLGANPRPMTEADLQAVFEAAW